MPQATVLIDGNNFYASCEQSLDPSLSGRPVVVLSNNDGCIVARSSEARSLGIVMGTPYFRVRQDLARQNVVVRSSNYALYADMSQRMMSLLEAHCEELEIYSIDEAFGRLHRPQSGDLHSWASQLRARVRRDLGLPIAIGIGTSKGQAKMANRLAKQVAGHAGIFDLNRCERADAWLATIAIEDVWGIGRKLARWCRMHGVSHALALRDMPSGLLQKKCGVVGLRLQQELRGHACLNLDLAPPPKQETCVSRSFSRPITTLEELRQAVATYIARAAEKLRKQRQRAACLTIYARTNPFGPTFYSRSASTRLDLPSNDTALLLQAALPMVDRIFHPHRQLVKAGVLMQHLQPSAMLQTHLMVPTTPEQQQRRDCLMQTMDRLNHRYGRNSLFFAAQGISQPWLMRRERVGTNSSTTRLNQIPIVKAQ